MKKIYVFFCWTISEKTFSRDGTDEFFNGSSFNEPTFIFCLIVDILCGPTVLSS